MEEKREKQKIRQYVLMNILGISCFYHDSAAALIKDGNTIAAAEEERFSRDKHDNSFPENAIDYCLEEGEIGVEELDKLVFYEKPIQKFDRILETAADSFPHGFRFFSRALPEWTSKKLRIRKKMGKYGYDGEIEFVEHHHSHASSTFNTSPFKETAILTIDGVGEWKTNQMFYGENGDIEPIKHIEFPDSLGLLYSTITAFLGFMVNNDEYKVMGLAAYGEPSFREEFRELIEIHENGFYQLDQDYFSYRYRKKMWGRKMEELLGGPREKGEELTQRHKDISATLQAITEEVLLKQTEHLYDITDTENLCMAGGVALNSKANGYLRKNSSFENIWIQPAAGDDGGALGAALLRSEEQENVMENVYLGPEYTQNEVRNVLDEQGAQYSELDREEIIEKIASELAEGKVIGLYHGRMEWGPRALGNRTIMADPREKEMIDRVNKKVKFRESFRPFAPTVLEDEADQYFDIKGESPFMLFTFDAKEDKKEDIEAVTHIDDTSRIQTLKRETNPFYYDIIQRFSEKTGVPVLLNTSFNLKGMPIVNTPEEAYSCFKDSGMDAVATRNFFIEE